jgi:UDP-GlcNAc:undecaprenyl-phosphate GlcNAc-1-phosphate transferase
VQIIAAIIAVSGNNLTDLFVDNDFFNAVITIVWIVFLTNSFNLLDNMDGLSCGIAAITSFIFFIIGINQGEYFLALFSITLSSVCVGFLLFNFSPASIFMGDGGSLVIGYLIAVIAVKGVYLKYSLLTRLPVIIPLLVLFVPIYDTLTVIFIRLKLRISIFKADKRHFSHRLVNLGITPKYAVLIIYMATLSTGITATLLPKLVFIDAFIILIHTFMIFGIIAILEWFGYKKYENIS